LGVGGWVNKYKGGRRMRRVLGGKGVRGVRWEWGWGRTRAYANTNTKPLNRRRDAPTINQPPPSPHRPFSKRDKKKSGSHTSARPHLQRKGAPPDEEALLGQAPGARARHAARHQRLGPEVELWGGGWRMGWGWVGLGLGGVGCGWG